MEYLHLLLYNGGFYNYKKLSQSCFYNFCGVNFYRGHRSWLAVAISLEVKLLMCVRHGSEWCQLCVSLIG